MRLAGRVAVVTGASRGLGLGIVKILAAAGAEVWAVAEQADELARACADVHAFAPVHTLVADLRNRGDIARIVRTLEREGRPLSVLVNNAAVLSMASLADTTDSVWDTTLAVNLTAPFMLTRLAAPLMRPHGSIINVSSRAGIQGFVDETAYCAAKFGIEGFTRAAALELAPLGIAINTVSPGVRIKPTGIDQATFDAMSPDARAQYRDPVTFGPAIELLATLRGEPSGLRFDLAHLTDDVLRLGFDAALDCLPALAG